MNIRKGKYENAAARENSFKVLLAG